MMSRAESRNSIREDVLERDEYTCQLCEKVFQERSDRLRIVQKNPRSDSEPSAAEDFEARCDRCGRLPNIPEQVVSKEVDNRFARQLEALDKATTVQSFGDDGLQIIKIALTVPAALTAIVGLGIKSKGIQNVNLVNNPYMWVGVGTWAITLSLAGVAYYYARTSGSSPLAIEQLFEEDEEFDEDDSVTEDTKTSYKWNARFIAGSIVALAACILLFGLGSLDALGLLQ